MGLVSLVNLDTLGLFNLYTLTIVLTISLHTLQDLNPIRFSCLSGSIRGLIADYGVPLMVLIWSAISYIPAGSGSVPKEIPRRLFSPNPWSPGAYENWTVIKALLHGFCVFTCFQLET